MITCLQQIQHARYHELDPRNRVRPTVIFSWLQEAAAEHALTLGVAVKDLRKLGLTWVLSRLTLELNRPIVGAEPITIRTWPVTRAGLFSIRDFLLQDQAGEVIGRASSSWAALALQSRRPVPLESHLPFYPLDPTRALDDPFATLPLLEPCQAALQLPVLRADLDMNAHVNNTVYPGWALEAVPAQLADRAIPVRIEIGFRAEAFYGDSIRSCCAASPDNPLLLLHRIESVTSGKELCRLRTTWQINPAEKA